jgi:hypothetical protein
MVVHPDALKDPALLELATGVNEGQRYEHCLEFDGRLGGLSVESLACLLNPATTVSPVAGSSSWPP